MDEKQSHGKGQAIVIMAFAIIALAAMVGLAIDGGNLYALRRRAQNAADGAALAGTRLLADLIAQCADSATVQAADGTIGDEILKYTRLNGVDEYSANGDITAWYVNKDSTELGYVGDGVPDGTTGIRVEATVTDTTSFMRLFGFRHIVAPAEATAMAGKVTQMGGGGLLPIAVWDEVVRHMPPGDEFTVKDSGEFKDFCEVTCPECCEGSVDSSAQRGWLQLGHIYNKDDSIMDRGFTTSLNVGSGCKPPSQAGLDQWLSPDCPYPYSIYAGEEGLDNGDFIVGMTGSKTAGDHAIKANWLNKICYVPVFDLIYSGTEKKADPRMETIFDPDVPQPIGTWVTGSSTYYFHITGFAAIIPLRYEGKDLVGEFQYASIKAGQINPGAGIGSGTCVPGLVGFALWD